MGAHLLKWIMGIEVESHVFHLLNKKKIYVCFDNTCAMFLSQYSDILLKII